MVFLPNYLDKALMVLMKIFQKISNFKVLNGIFSSQIFKNGSAGPREEYLYSETLAKKLLLLKTSNSASGKKVPAIITFLFNMHKTLRTNV